MEYSPGFRVDAYAARYPDAAPGLTSAIADLMLRQVFENGMLRERVQPLGGNVQYVLLVDREAGTHVAGELGRAGEALRSVRDLQENNARHWIKEAEDRLSSALGAFGRASAGE